MKSPIVKKHLQGDHEEVALIKLSLTLPKSDEDSCSRPPVSSRAKVKIKPLMNKKLCENFMTENVRIL